MAKRLPLDLKFPVGGLVKSVGFHDVPPNATPDCQDVRAWEVAEGRARGGQRPGMGKVYAEELGSGNPVRFLGQVTQVEGTGTGTIAYTDSDDFNRDGYNPVTLGAGWAAASWTGGSLGTVKTEGGVADNMGAAATEYGNVRQALDYSEASPYRIKLLCRNDIMLGSQYAEYYIYARLGAGLAIETDGLKLRLKTKYHATAGLNSYEGDVKVYIGSALDNTYNFSTGTANSEPKWLELDIDGDDIVVYWGGTTILTQAISAQAGVRVGFGIAEDAGNLGFIYDWQLVGSETGVSGGGGDISYKTVLVASSNGTVYSENDPGELTSVSGSEAVLSDDHLLLGTERGQKLYVADYAAAQITGTDGAVAANGTDLSAVGVADWTGYGISAGQDVCVVSAGTGDVTNGTYKISSIVTAKVVLASSVGGAGNCTYRIEHAPKVYDPSADTMTIWTASTGTVPSGCPLICTYRDSAVLAGGENNPHVWAISRQGDFLDFDYSQTDDQRAIIGTSADAGKIGDVLRALIPFSDDHLIFGGFHSLWLMRGDPRYQGFIDAISYDIGVVDKAAWCFGPNGEIYFLDVRGLYQLAPRPEAGVIPKPLSEKQLPLDLRDINTAAYDVLIAWDRIVPGVHLYVTPEDANDAEHWFWDARLDSWWRDKHASAHGPMAVLDYKSSTAAQSTLLLGGRDGYVRGYGRTYKSDDGVAIDSYVTYPPVSLGGSALREGVLLELEAVTGEDTDSLDYEVRVASTPELAVDATAQVSGTWNAAGRQYRLRPRTRGGALCMRLANGNTYETWMMESLVGISKPVGRHRKA